MFENLFYWRTKFLQGGFWLFLFELFVFCFINVLFGTSVFAEARINIVIPGSIDVEALPTPLNDGTLYTSSSVDNVSVGTDNFSGYTMMFSVGDGESSGDLELKRDEAVVSRIPSIIRSISYDDYNDTDFALKNNLNNTWGYRPSTLYDEIENVTVANTDFLPAPVRGAVDVIAKTFSANNETGGEEPFEMDNYNIALGTRLTNEIMAGVYSNTFVITAVANGIPYSVSYDANAGGDEVSNVPDDISYAESYDPDIVLDEKWPSRHGYRFIAWCDGETITSGGADSCDGTMYSPGDTIGLTDLSFNSINLKAMWTDNYTINYYPNPNQIDGTPLLVTIVGRRYSKMNEGNALTAYSYSPNGYTGPVLVSTDQEAVVQMADGECRSSDSFVFDGHDYYYSGCRWMQGNRASTDGIVTKKYSGLNARDAALQLLNDSKVDGDSQNVKYGQQISLKKYSFSNEYGYLFKGWSTTPTGEVLYDDEQSVIDLAPRSDSIDLYAIYGAGEARIVFDPTCTRSGESVSGSGTMDDQIITNTKETLNEITFTSPEGYFFNGWNTKQDGSGIRLRGWFSFDRKELGLKDGDEITLYAQWEPNESLDYIRNELVPTTYARLSTTVGDKMVFSGRSFTRTTDEPVIFMNAYNTEWHGYGIVAFRDVLEGTVYDLGQIGATLHYTANGTPYYAYRMLYQWRNGSPVYTIGDETDIRLSFNLNDPHILGGQGIVGNDEAALAEFEDVVDRLYELYYEP